jgi:hypothetical protein
VFKVAYNNFTLETVLDKFELNLLEDRFCQSLSVIDPQPEFLVVFDYLFELGEAAKSEKAKSELLVTPVLAQARRLTDRQVQLFSGEEFNVDQERGLNGFCDFLFTKSGNRFTIDAPVLMLVEAKRGEIESGWGQCVAEMVAAQIYNRNYERTIPIIYGCVTSGRLWQFFKLEDNRITIDPTNYSLLPVQKILGILKWILSQ